MKNYILTAEVRVDDNDIKMARKWEKRKRLDYKDDIAHLIFDCMTDNGPVAHEIIKTEIDEIKNTK